MQDGSYWWPRRKLVRRSEARPISSMNWELARRGYSGQTEERKVYNFPEGFDLVETFPDRIAEENTRRTKRFASNPLPKKGKAEFWTLDDLRSYREHFGEQDVIISPAGSSSIPTIPANVALKRIRRPPKPETEKTSTSDTSVPRKGRPPTSISPRSTDDAGEVEGGFAGVYGADKNERPSKAAGQVNDSVASVAEPREPDLKEDMDRSPPPKSGSMDSESLEKTAILEDTDTIEKPQRIQYRLIDSESDPDPDLDLDSVVGSLENLHDENAAEPAFRTDAGQDCLPQEQDEELERAMQYFNLGMWHRPWRPLPRTDREEELEKQSAKELSKQLELSKRKLEFNRTIHVLGLGTAGKYIAHSLASMPNGPPVTLLMHRPLVMQRWHDEGAAIRILINGEFHVQTGFHIESSANFRREHPDERFPGFGSKLEHTAEPPSSVIDTLIVTTDPNTTLAAISSIRHRLRKSTTICFIQDGLGILEKINQTIFPDPNERPTYVLGRMSHRLSSTERHFTIVEKKPGVVSCSKLAQVVETKDGYFSPTIKRENFSWSPQAQHLVGTLVRAPGLNAESLGHKSFFRSQLEKLVLGATIGPLSVAYDCSNDQLLYNYCIWENVRFLLQEISQIIQSLPELRTMHNIETTFSVEKLEAKVLSSIKRTGKNVSSMLQDVRDGKKTDVDFYTGYLVNRATELGIDCPRNQMLLQLVKGKQAIRNRMKNLYIPFSNEY